VIGFAVATLGGGCATQTPQVRVTGPADVKPLPPEQPPMPKPEDISHEQQARDIYNKAVGYFENQDWEIAIVEFKRALNVYPGFYKAHFKIGLCFYNLQKYDLEIQSYERCLEINPNYIEAWLNLGNARLAEDNLEKALIAYNNVLRLEPRHPVALFNLGLVYYDLGQYELAVKYLERYVENYPRGIDSSKADRYMKQALDKMQPRTNTVPARPK